MVILIQNNIEIKNLNKFELEEMNLYHAGTKKIKDKFFQMEGEF